MLNQNKNTKTDVKNLIPVTTVVVHSCATQPVYLSVPLYEGRYTRILTTMLNQHHLAHSANLPKGLYILLSVISSLFYSEQSYLTIYWTDFFL